MLYFAMHDNVSNLHFWLKLSGAIEIQMKVSRLQILRQKLDTFVGVCAMTIVFQNKIVRNFFVTGFKNISTTIAFFSSLEPFQRIYMEKP